jgi:DNA-directed RNA polymerase specialized sigma24 family protein
MEIAPQVFERAKKLKRPALEELFAQVYPAVVRIARGLTGREDVAEGVVRFMMVRAVGMVPRWRDETSAERWFLHHTVLTARRAAAHHGPDAKTDLLARDGDARYVAFVRAVRQLPVQQREALILSAGEHFNERYLGVAMDCSTDAAQAHLEAARAATRAVAGEDQFDSLLATMAASYARLGPADDQLRPAVQRWVGKALRPHRRRRLIKISVKAEDDGNKHLYFDAVKGEGSTGGGGGKSSAAEEKSVAQASSDAT